MSVSTGLQAYCPHCGLYEAWIEKHSADFCRRSCGLSLCDEKKVFVDVYTCTLELLLFTVQILAVLWNGGFSRYSF